MNMKEQTAELNRIPIGEVGRYLGLDLPAKGSARCPFPDHDDKSPSFEIKQNGLYWKCYGCNASGGSIDLVKHMLGISFLDARRWLLERTSNSFPTNQSRSFKQPLPTTGLKQTERPVSPESVPDFELYTKFLELCPIQPKGRNYLLSRCISNSTIEHFQIGQISNSGAIDKIIKVFGFDRTSSAGLLTKRSTAQRYHPIFPNNSLLFPYLSEAGIVYFQSRSIDDSATGSRWRNLNHRRRKLFNESILDDSSAKSVAICEGVMDSLSAYELNMEAVGLIGVSARLTKEQKLKLKTKKSIQILLDWDEKGEERSNQLMLELQRFGISAVRKVKPSLEINDLNDYLRKKRGKK